MLFKSKSVPGASVFKVEYSLASGEYEEMKSIFFFILRKRKMLSLDVVQVTLFIGLAFQLTQGIVSTKFMNL